MDNVEVKRYQFHPTMDNVELFMANTSKYVDDICFSRYSNKESSKNYGHQAILYCQKGPSTAPMLLVVYSGSEDKDAEIPDHQEKERKHLNCLCRQGAGRRMRDP